MSATSSSLLDLEMRAGRYRLTLARTPRDLEAAQRLRFKVFNLELKEGLAAAWRNGLDQDEYDSQCHHLLITDEREEEVVGTYRLQTRAMADKGAGFYSDQEFDLSALPADLLDQAVEVGRACIHRDHRSTRVLFFLWKGLACYLQHTGLRHLFGCCSLSSQDPEEGWRAWRWMRTRGLLDSRQAPARPAYLSAPAKDPSAPVVPYELPPLFRMYASHGATVLSEPAIDRSFGTIDFLVQLDTGTLKGRDRQTYFGSGQEEAS